MKKAERGSAIRSDVLGIWTLRVLFPCICHHQVAAGHRPALHGGAQCIGTFRKTRQINVTADIRPEGMNFLLFITRYEKKMKRKSMT